MKIVTAESADEVAVRIGDDYADIDAVDADANRLRR
jgi:hypothetical protein